MQNNFLKISKTEGVIALVFFIVFCIYFIPSLHHEIRVHDTFDGNFSTREVLIRSGHFFDTNPNAIVPGIMNGLPRGVFPRFSEITSILMFLFGSLNGYAITFVTVRLLAFAGVYLFGRDHLGTRQHHRGLLVLVAVAFACLPFFIIHGLTVAGIPLLLWAFFNIYKRTKTGISYAVLMLFVLWSNFVLVGFHALLCLFLLTVYFSFKDKKLHINLLLALSFIAILYVLSDYMLFYMHLFSHDYHSSRGEMERLGALNFFGVVGGTARSFFSGDYSTANYLGFIFIPVFLSALYLVYKTGRHGLSALFLVFSGLAVLFSFFINLLDWKSFAFFYEAFPFAKEFNFKRFTSLLPGLFFISLLAAVIIINMKQIPLWRAGTAILLGFILVFAWRGNISYNRSAFDTRGLKIISEQKLTFSQFFDPALYRQIKQAMGADTARNVIHFGLSPSPSKYAGLHVLDDYQGDYPREYKAQFRKVIAGELEKSESLRQYFDTWGSRCYMESANSFNNRLGRRSGMLYEPVLDVDTGQLKKMNCGYVLSSILIGNSAALNMRMEKVFVSAVDLKKIFLYKLI